MDSDPLEAIEEGTQAAIKKKSRKMVRFSHLL
jgi:hypothetical protein